MHSLPDRQRLWVTQEPHGLLESSGPKSTFHLVFGVTLRQSSILFSARRDESHIPGANRASGWTRVSSRVVKARIAKGTHNYQIIESTASAPRSSTWCKYPRNTHGATLSYMDPVLPEGRRFFCATKCNARNAVLVSCLR